jgi:hypothetical protein
MLEVSFDIPSAAGIPEGSSAIGGFLAELLGGWQPSGELFVTGWLLDGLSKAGEAISGLSAVEGSPEGAPPVGGFV